MVVPLLRVVKALKDIGLLHGYHLGKCEFSDLSVAGCKVSFLVSSLVLN